MTSHHHHFCPSSVISNGSYSSPSRYRYVLINIHVAISAMCHSGHGLTCAKIPAWLVAWCMPSDLHTGCRAPKHKRSFPDAHLMHTKQALANFEHAQRPTVCTVNPIMPCTCMEGQHAMQDFQTRTGCHPAQQAGALRPYRNVFQKRFFKRLSEASIDLATCGLWAHHSTTELF